MLIIDLPKIKGQIALILMQLTLLCNLVFYCLYLSCTIGVGHIMWGNELLGRGQCSLRAGIVAHILLVTHQREFLKTL